MYCPNCGAEIAPGAARCARCGRPVPTDDSGQSPSRGAPPPSTAAGTPTVAWRSSADLATAPVVEPSGPREGTAEPAESGAPGPATEPGRLEEASGTLGLAYTEHRPGAGPVAAQTIVPNYLIPAILACLCCCCLPLGLPAVYYAAKANGKAESGDPTGALEAARNAKIWTWLAIGFDLVLWAGLLFSALLFMIADR